MFLHGDVIMFSTVQLTPDRLLYLLDISKCLWQIEIHLIDS
jgi:hypothetical protein